MADENQETQEAGSQTEGQTAPGAGAGASSEGTALTQEAPAQQAEATNWRDTLDPDLKAWANKFDSPATALKSYRELEKKMGRSVTIPGKDATPEEIQAFRKKALGVPDAPTDYKLELPGFVPEEVRANPMSDPMLKEFVETSHANGKSPEQVQADLNLFYKAIEASKEQAAQESARLTQQKQDDLKREWGSDFEANGTYARRAVKQFDADGKFTEFLNNAEIDGVKVGDHPDFARFFAKVGRALAEDSVQLEPTGGEVQAITQQASQLRQQRNEALRRGDRTTAQRLDEQERALYARMGNQPIVGTAGRVA